MEIPARMGKSFNKPIYACFKPAEVKHDGRGHCYLNFPCDAADIEVACEKICKPYKLSSTITAVFKRIGQEKVTYSHRQLTWTQTNNRPFSIVKDCRFRKLMKTEHPAQYIPDPSTVSGRIAKLLQDYQGKLSFTTDVWMSPNHRAFIATCVHLEWKGEPLSLLLDLVELPKVHCWMNA
ncbi:hypothetical protein C8J57DRAFT_1437036 [Mycena rebaudengoi]|nr:hypothetical protein C8J57DRAFT_1437036 [Mycena rebaudengoi]